MLVCHLCDECPSMGRTRAEHLWPVKGKGLHGAQQISVLGDRSDLLSLEVLDLKRSSNRPQFWWKV